MSRNAENETEAAVPSPEAGSETSRDGALGRRAFLLGAGAGLAAAAAAACLPDVDGQWQEGGCTESCPAVTPQLRAGDPANAGRVAEVYSPDLVPDERKVDAAAAEKHMKELLLGISKQADLASAWKTLIPTYQPGEIIGIKVNMIAYGVPTQPAVIKALVDHLKTGMGISGKEIVIWDRRLDEFTKRADMTPELMGATIEGTIESVDEHGNPIQGAARGYEFDSTCLMGQKTHLSAILTRHCDHLINLSVMKDHPASGFTGVMKNHYGSISNPGCFHDDVVDEVVVADRFGRTIPELNALDEIAGKTRLWMMDATIGTCKNGNMGPADCRPKRLLAALDPVALDARGKELRDESRGKSGPSKETISANWLEKAASLGLGSLKPDILTI